MRTLQLGFGVLLGLCAAPLAHAGLFAIDRRDDSGSRLEAGWAGGWAFRGALGWQAGKGGIAGSKGSATRLMTRAVFPARQGESYFRITLRRTGGGSGGDADFAGFYLNDDSFLTLGLSSSDTYMAGLGGTTRSFGSYTEGQTATLVGRLRVDEQGAAALDVWAWEDESALPETPPDRPKATLQGSLPSKPARTIRLGAGSKDKMQAEFLDVRVGDSWEAVTSATPPPVSEISDYRVFQPIRVAADSPRTLALQWSTTILLPGAPGQPPRIVVQSDHPWREEGTVIYSPLDAAAREGLDPAPNPRLPLYGEPKPYDKLPGGFIQAVPQKEGGYQLIRMSPLSVIGKISEQGEVEIFDQPSGIAVEGVARAAFPRTTFLGDVNGDGVPDLLVTRKPSAEEQAAYWPKGQSPWRQEKMPLIGPHLDPEVTDGYRGYDIAGHWLGARMPYGLDWHAGKIVAGQLAFGPSQTVYFGRDDYPLIWAQYAKELAPAVMDFGGKPYVILFGDIDRALALPVLEGAGDQGLHLGKPVDLLAPDADRGDLNMPTVVGVADFTGDGRPDLAVGSGANGRLSVLGGERPGAFQDLGAVENLGGQLAADTLTVPARGDWTGDGKPDLVTGDGSGLYQVWSGTDDPLVYRGNRPLLGPDGQRLLVRNPTNLQGPQEDGWSYTQPALFDWTGDGRLDVIGNNNGATLTLYTRPSERDPYTVREERFTLGGQKFGVAWRTRSAVVPGQYGVAGDDRPVILFHGLDQFLGFAVPREKGSTEIEKVLPVVYTDQSRVRTSGSAGLSGRTQLSVADWDGDGKWDIVFNITPQNQQNVEQDPDRLALSDYYRTSAAYWLRNVGTNAQPVFEKARRFLFADGSVPRVEGHAFNVEPSDLNGDGQPDLLMGDGPGFIYYLPRESLSWK